MKTIAAAMKSIENAEGRLDVAVAGRRRTSSFRAPNADEHNKERNHVYICVRCLRRADIGWSLRR